MKDFVLKIVTSLVDSPDEVGVEETQDDMGTLLKLQVAETDMGRVIGKSGRVIKAIRDLVRVKSIKAGLRANLMLEESAITGAT